ncbi:MAG TPA: DUF1533 domain-containing protein, partial [Gelria sp.]|nr:DUF1533 domain-containing protein [Gelria sp.]
NPVIKGAGKMAAGGRHTLLVDSSGNVWAWGQNDYGQLGIDNKKQQLEPVKVDSLSNVVAVAAGDNHSLALDGSGNVYAWGRNNLYQLGNDTTDDSLTPTKVFEGVKAIATAANYCLALKTDGTVWGWGEAGEANCGYSLTNGNGRTPVQMCYNTNVPTDIHPFENVKGIAAAPRFAAYLFNDGRICRQGYFIDTVGAPTYSPRGHYSSLMGVQGIVAGDEFVAALLADGTVATLGNNIQGQFGNGGQSNATPASPVPYAKVKGLTKKVEGIAAGGAHGIALDSDGNVWTWGKNQYGQLGNGSNIVSLVPIQVQGLSGITAVAGGRDNTLAMQNDQKVYAWGENSGGQLGSGDKLSSKLPVLVRMTGYDEAVNAPVWPASFTIVKKAQTADSITLMWTPAKSSISIGGYEVYQDGNKVGEVSGNTYEYTVKELQKDKDYTFGIKAKDSAENVSDLSNTISLTFTGEEEGGIDNLAPEWDAGAVITTDGKTPYTITISWLAAKDNVAVTGYRIFANGKNAGSTSKTSYTIGDLSPDREYLITVEALDAAYNVSEPLFTTIKTPDTMPFLWMAEVTNKGDISLTFSKAMADPVGTHEQFTAKIDGADAQIKGVESTNTVEKIKLVLENKIDSYEKIVITYTKSEEPDKQIKSTDGAAVESFIAHIGKSAPSLTADTTNNALGQAIEITFTPDADWVKAITDVTVDGISTEGKYTISEGKIVLNPEVFSLPGQYHIIVKAEGYSDAGVIQVISSDQDTVGRLVIFQKPFASYAGPTGGVGIDGEFKVGFMEQIVPESLKIILNKIGTTGNLESKKESVAFTYELNQNKVLNIKTKEKLDYGTYYELVLPAGIEDVKGNISEDDSKVVFYTASFKPPVYKVTQDGKEVSGVVAGQSYQLTATLENSSDQSQTVDAILQLRGGKGARENQGGDVLDQLNQRITVDSRQTTDVTLEFTVPVDIDSSVIYGDIFIWEKDGVYASAEPVHFSCPVN